MKFAVVLLVLAVCGATIAEPQLGPIKFGLHLGHQGIKFAGNIIDSIFGNHHKNNGGGGVKVGATTKAGANDQFQVIIELFEKIVKAITSGNFRQITIYITQIISKLRALSESLGGNASAIIQIIIQNLNKLAAAGSSGNKVQANSMIAQIQGQLKQAASAAASGAKGGGAKGGTGGNAQGGGKIFTPIINDNIHSTRM